MSSQPGLFETPQPPKPRKAVTGEVLAVFRLSVARGACIATRNPAWHVLVVLSGLARSCLRRHPSADGAQQEGPRGLRADPAAAYRQPRPHVLCTDHDGRICTLRRAGAGRLQLCREGAGTGVRRRDTRRGRERERSPIHTSSIPRSPRASSSCPVSKGWERRRDRWSSRSRRCRAGWSRRRPC